MPKVRRIGFDRIPGSREEERLIYENTMGRACYLPRKPFQVIPWLWFTLLFANEKPPRRTAFRNFTNNSVLYLVAGIGFEHMTFRL